MPEVRLRSAPWIFIPSFLLAFDHFMLKMGSDNDEPKMDVNQPNRQDFLPTECQNPSWEKSKSVIFAIIA